MEKKENRDKEGKNKEGRYIYCIAAGRAEAGLGAIGIEGNKVYTIPSGSLLAVVHDCEAKAYSSGDEATVKRWVSAHQNTIEKAQEMFGTVIPLGFDVIIKGENAGREVANWLEAERGRLEANLERLRGKQEFGVQLIWEPVVIGKKLSGEDGQIKNLVEEAEKTTAGKAYFIREKVKKALKQEMEKLADNVFRQFYSGIKRHCCDIKVDKNKKIEEGKEMLANMSCLVEKNKAKGLGAELDKTGRLEGFSTRFTGPWPPYSFVT